MDKKIPIYFDNVIIASPLEKVSESNPNLGRLRVGVFTKYGNRNGSYITDAVAEMLIDSAIKGDTPVIGFFDPETQSWASHTGPTLASAYGYVETFNGWEPLEDTDGVTRDYAIFTVVLFTKYFDEAKLIVGQNQSMELDVQSIDGEWATIEDNEYFVYTKAAIQGLCVIGAHEPCFSVSSFFEKNDEIYETQYQKFSSLLAEAKAQVEEANKGGDNHMDEENKVVPEEEVVEFEQQQETEIEEQQIEEPEISSPEAIIEPEVEPITEEVQEEPSEFEILQQKFNDLQADYDAAMARITELETFQATANTELETLRDQNQKLQTSVQTYEAQVIAAENQRKENLLEKYEKILNGAEEIENIRAQVSDFSYDELESKLAVLFAHKQFAGSEVNKVPLPEPKESEFSLLMKKYRK